MVNAFSTTVQRVLSMPELLSIILLFSDRHANASNLFVCKRWAHEVLKVEWEVVDDPLSLLGLLAPITETDMIYTYAREPSPDDWTVFNRYASRVRALTWDVEEMISYNDICRVLGSRRKLLPNLKTLNAPLDITILRHLVHPHLTSLTLLPSPEDFLRDEDPQQIRLTLDHLSEDDNRPLRLRHLAFEGIYLREHAPFTIAEPALINFLRPLKEHLVSLILRPIWLSVNITHAVAHFPYLVKLVANDPNNSIDANPLTFSDTLDYSSFSALQHLALMIRFERAICCLSSGVESLSRLTTLALVSDRFEHPTVFNRIFALVSQLSPSLTDLEVESNGPASPDERHFVVAFEDLKPVLRLGCLNRLAIVYPTPLQLKRQDLETIVRPLKHLSILLLNPEPSVDVLQDTFHMSDLSTLSFPNNLEEISVYVDTSPRRFPMVDELVVLRGLKRLCFGFSTMTKDAVVPSSVYLSHILPESFSIPWSFCTGIGDRVHAIPWEEVRSLVPVLMGALQNGKNRAMLSQKGLFCAE